MKIIMRTIDANTDSITNDINRLRWYDNAETILVLQLQE